MIRDRVQQITNNPVNMGTDEANAELEQLRAQLDSMIQTQGRLNQAVQNMDVAEANAEYMRLSQTVSQTERNIRDNVNAQGAFNSEIQEGSEHGGHGWLINQFLSPYFNHRTDEYGGCFENRIRFAREVLSAVREAVGPGFPIEFRMSGSEFFEGGSVPAF